MKAKGNGIIRITVYKARAKLTGKARTAAKNDPNYNTFDRNNVKPE